MPEKKMEGESDELLEAARSAAGKAYAPYSGFRVGAAVLGSDGRVYRGANVENASYGLSICAERAAIISAASAGELSPVRLAIAAAGGEDAPPCGACRQVLNEFSPEAQVTFRYGGEFRTQSLRELLPQPFDGGRK